MPDAAPPPGARANYGFDAPGIMNTMLAIGASIVAIGIGVGVKLPWRYGPVLGGLIAASGAVPLSLGCMMLYYGLAGKHRTREAMLGFIRWRGDETILDVGAGSGMMMIGAAKRLTRGGRAIGIDIWSAKDLSDNSVETTKRNIAIEGVGDRTEIVTGDASRLDFPDASFDHVLSLLCLHNIEPKADRDQACREIARVLKPGGSAVIGDYIPTDNYAGVFRADGLNVVRSKPAFEVARSLMWLLVAEKPAATGRS